jgi:hypothetical protein
VTAHGPPIAGEQRLRLATLRPNPSFDHDPMEQHQLIGLALIAMFLRSDRPGSVEIVNLHSGKKPAGSDQLACQFGAICSRLKRRLQPYFFTAK